MNSSRVCIDCKHFYFFPGDSGWSEWTPGSNPEMRCNKSHWEFDFIQDSYSKDYADIRDVLKRAEVCIDFEEGRDEYSR